MKEQSYKKVLHHISSDKIQSVAKGLAILKTLVDTEHDLRLYLPYPQECTTVKDLHDFMTKAREE